MVRIRLADKPPQADEVTRPEVRQPGVEQKEAADRLGQYGPEQGRPGEGNRHQPTLTEELRRGQQEALAIRQDLADIAADLRVLLQQEAQLARSEARQYVQLSIRALVWGNLALVFGLLTLAFLFTTAMFGLDLVLPLWMSALATTVLLAILAAGAGLMAFRRFRQVRLIPQKTMESVKEDVKWLYNQITSNGR